MITGMSTALATAKRLRSDIGAFNTTPIAPWHSTSLARDTVLRPLVVPPPTPQNTGIYDAFMMASEIACWGVKGYTANTASASQFLIMAKSVVKTKLLILRPLIIMPLALDID